MNRKGLEVRVGVAVPAAGSGQRMGGARKPFLLLAGEPVLLHAIRPFLDDPRVVVVAVALAADDAADPPAWLEDVDERVRVVAGGASRGASVAQALDAIPADVDLIAVHDAARPLLTADVVARCLDIAAGGIGAVAGSRAVDTIKQVDADDFVTGTPDRSTLWQAHTPQVFPAALLRAAYAEGDASATDDSALVERAGGRIRMVDDGGENLKVTRSSDLPIAEAVLAERRGS